MQPPEAFLFNDDGSFPNSRLPALLYRGVLSGRDLGQAFDAMFAKNGWSNSWRNGLYSFHHYHSTAHEVLGIHRGNVKVMLGGEKSGRMITVSAGDVVVIPAGVAHRNVEASSDYGVVGAYPSGTSPDVQYGKSGERPGTDKTIASLLLPAMDPVSGAAGSLNAMWSKAR